MQCLEALRYYCSPEAEREPENYRLTQIINLINVVMPMLEAVEMHRQSVRDFDAALEQMEGIE